MELKRVVVTGMGAITPLGSNVPEFWEKLKNGVSGADRITRFDASKFKTQFACEIKNYDSKNYFDRKEAKKLDLFTQFALISADEAILDSKLDLSSINLDKAGVVWGSGIGGMGTLLEEIGAFAKGDGTPRFSPFFIPKLITDIASGHISIKYGLRGPNYVTTSACASASHAIIDAFTLIRMGKAHVMVSGGSEACINEAGVGGFNSMHALSTRNDDPQTASRPFDQDRDGFVIGEGGCALILEEYEHAIARGAKIYAEMVGGGMSADAHHLTAPHPQGLGAIMVMKNALEDAGLEPNQIDYVNVHGTSTPLGDIAEPIAVKAVFGEHAYNINISSTKSMTGHLLGAAGAVEAIVAILSTVHDLIPPTINHFTDDPNIDPELDLTFNVAKHRTVNYAMSNTFGFGGHNATVIFKKFKQ